MRPLLQISTGKVYFRFECKYTVLLLLPGLAIVYSTHFKNFVDSGQNSCH